MAPTVRNFSVQATDLLAAARWVDKATSRDNSMFAITIEESVLTIEAYNSIHASTAKVSVDQKFDGQTRFSVDSKLFLDAFKNFGANTVEASFTERKLNLVAPKMRYSIPVTVPRNVNTLPAMPERFGTVQMKTFSAMLAHAATMATDDPSAPSLTTVHFAVSPQNKFFKMMSTDRYRMVIRKVAYEPDANASMEEFNFDVDARALKELIADIGEADQVSLYAADPANGNSRLFGIGTNSLRASVAFKDVKAINYSAFEKMSSTNSVIFERKSLTSAITKSKSAISGSVKSGVIIIEDDAMKLVTGAAAGSNASSNDVATEMECEMLSHDLEEKREIHANLDFISTILRAGSSKYVRFGLSKPNMPVLVYEMIDEKMDDPNYFSLFMTIHV